MTPRDLPKLKVLTVLAPVAFVILTEVLRDAYLVRVLSRSLLGVVVALSTLVAAIIFSEFVFNLLQRMQRLLDRERQRIGGIFLHTSDAVLLLDYSGRVVAMNPAGHRLSGYSEEAVRNGEVRFEALFSNGKPRPAPAWWPQLWERGQLPYFEATVVSPDGKTPVIGSATAIPAPEGGTHVALIMRDIREQKFLEAELERRRLQAEGLYGIGLDLASLGELEESLKSVLRKVKDILGVDLAGWAFMEEGIGDLTWKMLEDRAGVQLSVSDFQYAGVVARQAMATGQPVLDKLPCRTLAAVPVLLRGRSVGVLLVGAWLTPEPFSQADLLFLSSVTNQAAVALENHELYKHSQGQAVLEERERLAKEMHDGFGQTLTYLSAMVATVEQILHKGKTEEALAKLAETRAMLTQAHQEVRTAIFNLRERPSEEDFVAQVGRLLVQLGRQSGIKTELQADSGSRVKLPFETEIQVMRVIQEAMANVRKHSGATRAVVQIARNEGVLEVTVTDNGRGFRLENAQDLGQHFGLRIMQERSQAVGGALEIESTPGRGTRVRLTVPLQRWRRPA